MARTQASVLWRWMALVVLAVLLAALAALGQGQLAIALLAMAGAAAGILIFTGQLAATRYPGHAREKIWRALSALPVPAAVSTPRGTILWHNQAFSEAVFNGQRETGLQRIGDGDPEAAKAVFRLISAARQGKPCTGIIRFQGRNAIRLHVRPCTGAAQGGALLLWSADAEFGRELSVKDSPAIIETIAAPTVILSATGDVQHANDAAQKLLGTRPKLAGAVSTAETVSNLITGAPFAAALISIPGDVEAENDAFRKLFPSLGHPQKSLFKVLSADAAAKLKSYLKQSQGKVALLEIDGKPNGGQIIKFTIAAAGDGANFVVFAQETLAEATMDVEAVQSHKMAAVGQLAGGIAHDFNNLLTAIIGFSDLLLVRFRPSDPAFKDVMNIKNNAVRAEKLVRQILAYSSKQTLRPTLVSLTDVIQDFYSNMGQTLGEKVKARIQHERDLWFVKADESQLVQVVMNLALNARDAMPNGGELSIRTANVSERDSIALKERGLERGEYVMCEVRDTGTGIDPAHLKKIFDPFFSTKEVGKGTGLGLSTVFGIVKQTGGTILVDSEIGAGTAFRIFLPRHVETDEDLKALAQRSETRAPSTDLTGSGTVLLVEDEEAVRSFASRALTTRGYTVLEASTGVEALEVMEREGGRIDLVVSDVVMPEMDGPTLLRHLRKQNPGIKFVFMSGYAEEAFRKNLGVDEDFTFLPKPFTLKKLAETVKAAAA